MVNPYLYITVHVNMQLCMYLLTCTVHVFQEQSLIVPSLLTASIRKDSIADDPPSSVPPLSQKMVPTPVTPSSVKSRTKHPKVKPEPTLVKVTNMYSVHTCTCTYNCTCALGA